MLGLRDFPQKGLDAYVREITYEGGSRVVVKIYLKLH